MRRWLKWVLGIVGVVAIGIGALFGWSALEYGSHPLFPHHRITITLPYSPANEVQHLIPMGETIAHPFKGGHPGIDFQWDHLVPLIAVADGTITSISRADDMGEPVWYVTLRSGAYNATYKELDTYAPGLRKGSQLKQGDLVGTPHCVVHVDQGQSHTGCQLHWEFAYASFVPTIAGKPDRLCPLTYFDADALRRINAAWTAIDPATDQFKAQFPDICSSIYKGHDQ